MASPEPAAVNSNTNVSATLASTNSQSAAPGERPRTPALEVSAACLPSQLTPAKLNPPPDPELGGTVTSATIVPAKWKKLENFLKAAVSFSKLLSMALWTFISGIFPLLLVAASVNCIALAFAASFGSIAMLAGNGALRAAHLAHYTDNASAAAIGSVGAIVVGLVLRLCRQFVVFHSKWRTVNSAEMLFRKMLTSVVVQTIIGAIGSSILLSLHVDLGPIDVLHAIGAGTLGGAILGPVSVNLALSIVEILDGTLSPVWNASFERICKLCRTIVLHWQIFCYHHFN